MPGALSMDGTKLERHLDEVVRWRRGEWFAPIHMELSLTNVCNQHCTFCYIDWSHGKARMSEAMVERLVRDAKRVGIKSCLIAGEGEPTVNKAYLRAIEVAGEVGLDVALGIQQVLLEENAATTYDLARLAKEIGVDYWVVKPCHPHEMNAMGYTTMANLVERHRATLERAEALSDDRFKAVVRWSFLGEVERPRTYARSRGSTRSSAPNASAGRQSGAGRRARRRASA